MRVKLMCWLSVSGVYMTARTSLLDVLSQHRCVIYLGQPVPNRQNDVWSKNVDVGTISFARGKTKANIARLSCFCCTVTHDKQAELLLEKSTLTETYVWLI